MAKPAGQKVTLQMERKFEEITASSMARFTVTNTNDSGVGSLRQAITSAGFIRAASRREESVGACTQN